MEVLHVKSILYLLAVACAPVAVAADTMALQRCRQIADPAGRLACYDAVDLTAPSADAATGQQALVPVAPASQRSGPMDSLAVPPAATPIALFGMEARQAASQGLDALDSAIAGPFDGWVPRQRLRLANGQLWEISDGSQAAYRLQGPKVRITRGMSGTFFIAIEGVTQTPRVRRIE
jgi:hypothetical protein